MEEIICKSCKEYKTTNNFYKRKDRSRGYHKHCKNCLSLRLKDKPHQERLGSRYKSKEFDNSKLCTICNLVKDLKEFKYANKNRTKLKSTCNNCSYLYERVVKYNLTIEEYLNMLKTQNYKCKICSEVNKNGKELSIDHCHKTGRVRGLLCQNCNLGLGFLKDNIELLKESIIYLS